MRGFFSPIRPTPVPPTPAAPLVLSTVNVLWEIKCRETRLPISPCVPVLHTGPNTKPPRCSRAHSPMFRSSTVSSSSAAPPPPPRLAAAAAGCWFARPGATAVGGESPAAVLPLSSNAFLLLFVGFAPAPPPFCSVSAVLPGRSFCCGGGAAAAAAAPRALILRAGCALCSLAPSFQSMV